MSGEKMTSVGDGKRMNGSKHFQATNKYESLPAAAMPICDKKVVDIECEVLRHNHSMKKEHRVDRHQDSGRLSCKRFDSALT